jgi:hypothetical protein
MSDSKPVSTLLPPELREALIRASRIQGTDRERTIAIEKATRLARRTQPNLFKEEDHEN